VHGAVLVVDGCSVGGPQHLGMMWIRVKFNPRNCRLVDVGAECPTSHGIIFLEMLGTYFFGIWNFVRFDGI